MFLLNKKITWCIVLTLLMGGSLCRAHADVLIVSYLGPQDKYIPCIILIGADSDSSLPDLNLASGCKGINITVSTTPEIFLKSIDKLLTTDNVYSSKKSENSLVFVLNWGKEQRLFFDIQEGVSILRRVLTYFPEINDVVEQIFIGRIPRQ